MSLVFASWFSGWRRVGHAKALLAGVFVATFALAIPFALTVRNAIQAHLGRSLMAAGAADGVNYDWWTEFSSQATGLSTTFTPAIIGFASALDSLSRVLDGRGASGPLLLALAAYLALWAFLSGGVIDRYARQRPTHLHGFFAAAGVSFFRFLRLAVVAGAAYWLLFGYLHAWLFDRLYRDLTRGLAVERTAFLWRLLFYAVFGAMLIAVNVVFDYARIRIVVEDRRSALGALRAAMRFVVRRPGRVIGLYLLNGLVFLLLIALWSIAAPGVHGAGAATWLAFLAGQLYLVARLALKLHFLASQTALFQNSLAHATYTAAPEVHWPESPAAEAIAQSASSI